MDTHRESAGETQVEVVIQERSANTRASSSTLEIEEEFYGFVERAGTSLSAVEDPMSSTNLSLSSSETFITATDDDYDEEGDKDIYKGEASGDIPPRGRRSSLCRWIEWVVLILVLALLLANLLDVGFKGLKVLGQDIWRWSLLIVAIFSGRLISSSLINILMFLIERRFLFKLKKFLYFVHGMKKSVVFFFWSSLIWLSWYFILYLGSSGKDDMIFFFVSRLLTSVVLGSALWMLKTLLVKKLSSTFYMTWFFDQIRRAFFHQYLVQILSGPPLMQLGDNIGNMRSSGQLSLRTKEKGKRKGTALNIDVRKLCKTSATKISGWTMEELVHIIRTSDLSTLSHANNQSSIEGENKEMVIKSESDAKLAAYKIFMNVAKPHLKFISSEDLSRFLIEEEMEYMMTCFEGAIVRGKIRKSALTDWVVKAYDDCKFLAHTLNDTQKAIDHLNKVASTIVSCAILLMTLVLAHFAVTKVLVAFFSSFLLGVFVFRNYCKMAFEGMVFVFYTHPFIVGDCCMIDDIPMTVHEMNIMSTTFLNPNKHKVYFRNSELAAKFTNISRSPDTCDIIKFYIPLSTSMEKITDLKGKIKMYIDNKPYLLHPNHTILIKDMTEDNKLMMTLKVNHKRSYRHIDEKDKVREGLITAVKRIREELSI